MYHSTTGGTGYSVYCFSSIGLCGIVRYVELYSISHPELLHPLHVADYMLKLPRIPASPVCAFVSFDVCLAGTIPEVPPSQ